MNNRPLSHASDISPYTKRGWTVLVRVLERHPVTTSRGNPPVTYRRYLLSDMKGVKVSAVSYGSDVEYFDKFLLPMKQYFISNAGVRHVLARFQTDGYKYSWTLSKNTLVEPFDEPEPSCLPVAFELKKFSDLTAYADLDIPISMKLLVLQAFPVEPVSPNSSTRDFIIINEEKIPMMLRMWKELHEKDGLQIVNKFPQPTVILAMNLKVTTFHGLSLGTRYNTCFIHDPPEEDTEQLMKWYETNNEEVTKLLAARVYRDVSGFIAAPKASSILRISEAKDTIETLKTAWISGKTTLIPALDRVVYTICSWCHKSLRADTDWEFTCTNCHEKTMAKLRCHLELFITDGSAVLEVEMYSPYAEQLMGMTAEDIHKAQIDGTPIEKDIEKAVENKKVVCFIKFFDKEFRGATKRKYIVVKMFPASEVFGDVGDVNMVALATETSRNPDGLAAEKQFFSPTTKLIIEGMLEEKNNEKGEVGQVSGVKRSLQFDDTGAQPSVAATVPLHSEDAGVMQMGSTAPLVTDSPGKKTKPKMKQS